MSDDDFVPDLTPMRLVQYGGHDIWLKRDDLYQFAGVRGGKVRSCLRLSKGATMLVTASSRHSPQMTIVARIAQRLGIPARCHLATGEHSPEMHMAEEAGAVLVRHKPGYNSVIIKRAEVDAVQHNATIIPFGMKCREAVEETALQVRNLPPAHQFNRLVVSVGSGISLAGILTGIQLYRSDLRKKHVLGIQVGAAIESTMDRLAPFGWRTLCEVRRAVEPYHVAAPQSSIAQVVVDPHYEGKVLGFLRPHDVFWVVGIRRSTALNGKKSLDANPRKSRI